MTFRKNLSERRTEDIALDLLNIQSWRIARPPKGDVVRQNEYKDLEDLKMLFSGKSKTGKGDGYPDFLLLSPETSQVPLVIIETKANEREVEKGLYEATIYADACYAAGYPVLAVSIAGQEKVGVKIRCAKRINHTWVDITYNDKPIAWIPTPKDAIRLLKDADAIDLRPIVPRPEVLREKADYMNRILREANVKDEYRPAYIGSIMLALWQSRGNLSREKQDVLVEINRYCEQAFAMGGKSELALSLRIDEANDKLAENIWRILSTLELLNVVAGAVDHDYLGQLYEQFFQYTGGNTIGQYFTPRHITRFMADLCEFSKDDIVIDPTCGTGGFLIACLQRAHDEFNMTYEQAIEMVKAQLIGFESEPVTAALCVVNMILRGDGKSGIHKADCLKTDVFPINTCQIALMNPPFPHKKTDTQPQRFVERALEALKNRGKLAVILPTSLLVKREIGVWREKLLSQHTLEAVIQLPDELFQPYASATTSIVILQKGLPHDSKNKKTCFVRLRYDGLTLKKQVRVQRLDGKNDIPKALDAVLNHLTIPGFSGLGNVKGQMEWSVGAYIDSAMPTETELKEIVDETLRRYVSFYTRYALEVTTQRQAITDGELVAHPYREMLSTQRLKNSSEQLVLPKTISHYFDIFYGQKALHSREGLQSGKSLIISPTEQYNGCYGWLEFNDLIQAPFITVAQTGSIGETFVQTEACGVNDDCLILIPKPDQSMSVARLFIAAAVLRSEKWRFNYGRKLTPERIRHFQLDFPLDLEEWVKSQLTHWQKVIEQSLMLYYPATL